MKFYTIRPENKVRLDQLLRKELPALINKEVSNSKIRRLIVAGAVNVNGKQIRIPAYTVFAGSSVSVAVEEEKLFFEKQPDDIKYEVRAEDVLFEDDSIIVLNKPSHFPTEAGMVDSRDNLHAALVRYLFERQKIEHPNAKNPPYAGIMHRLDRDTSGVILFTKKRDVNGACHDMFENHRAKKEYIACVTSASPKVSDLKAGKKFTVEFFMGRISPKGQAAKWGRLPKNKGGLSSNTDFEVLKKDGDKIFIRCSLYTGRTHQIRVHLSDSGLPLLGDELYGGKPFERIMLHAESLTFPHPVTKELIRVEAPLPEIFKL